MKKQIFLLSLLSLSLFSCGNNKPTDEYAVTEQEMKDAFAMKNVKYLQINRIDEGHEGSHKEEFTPTSYHVLNEVSASYSETLILKDGDNYSKYHRKSSEEPFAPETYEEGDFKTITEYVDETFEKIREKEYSDFYYSEERKEYTTYFYTDSYIAVSLFRFLNKKLSNGIQIFSDLEKVVKTNLTYTYDKIEPPSPTI